MVKSTISPIQSSYVQNEQIQYSSSVAGGGIESWDELRALNSPPPMRRPKEKHVIPWHQGTKRSCIGFIETIRSILKGGWLWPCWSQKMLRWHYGFVQKWVIPGYHRKMMLDWFEVPTLCSDTQIYKVQGYQTCKLSVDVLVFTKWIKSWML